jgi:23S rRNA pseudouridine955/2504/2580 synthase
MKDIGKEPAIRLMVDEASEGQRIDNFLAKALKGVPRSHVYRLLRTGQIRLNSGRVDSSSRVHAGDQVRIPPLRRPRTGTGPSHSLPPSNRGPAVLFEDEDLLVLEKPAGLAVHGGSGISLGAIEEMRLRRPELRFLELVHRLDRDTSGVLLLAKKRGALTALHATIRAGQMRKRYTLMVKGEWKWGTRQVDLPLEKRLRGQQERWVRVSADGMQSRTVFAPIRILRGYSLLSAELLTGRTHQIRVHAAHCGFPIVGDEKYGDFAINKRLVGFGLKRMFLHASRVEVGHPRHGRVMVFESPLSADLARFLTQLEATHPTDCRSNSGDPFE